MSLLVLFAVTALAAQEAPPPDLATRKAGADWPGFLGANHDSKSPETGVAAWPAAGPRLVWQRPLGISYGICSIYRGRAYQFDRAAGKAVLYCLHSETGQELW